MDAAKYQIEIRKAEKSLGVFRAEFVRARVRLADIYVRIEMLQKSFEAGEFGFTTVIQTRNGEQEIIDPHMAELDSLCALALTYEKALGLTADSVRKINPEIFAPRDQPADPFAALFKGRSAG